jgi:16S rRNA (guanine527-N7)-methyltransferase
MLGAAPIREVITHSEAFVDALAGITGTVVDLGSGGGVPGLVIAWRRPDLEMVLVDRRATRCDHLCRLVLRLGLTTHVSVLNAEAASLPHLLDGPVDAVVARSFGPPEAVLAAAVPIVSAGGVIVVSEPPQTGSDRWPDPLLDRFGVERMSTRQRLAIFRRLSARR